MWTITKIIILKAIHNPGYEAYAEFGDVNYHKDNNFESNSQQN